MKHFSLVVDNDGVALITFDMQDRRMNVLSDAVQAELGQLIEQLRGRADIRGAVIASAKPDSFCVGADLSEFTGHFDAWRQAADERQLAQGLAHASTLSRQLRALETCGKPVVAVLEGMALGGGLELALACHYRLAAEGAKLRLAFPEVGVGLLPGAGGTQRLLRLMGINPALPYLLDGTPIEQEAALQCGVIHELAPADQLLERARRWVLDNPEAVAPWDSKGFKVPGGGPHSPAGIFGFGPSMAARLADDGTCYPARANLLKSVYEGSQVPMDAALAIESWHFFNTLRTPQAKAMSRAFFSTRQALAKRSSRGDNSAYLAQLRQAVDAQLEALRGEGVSPTLLANLARSVALDGVMVPEPGKVVQVADVDFAEIEQVRERLLMAQSVAALRALHEGLVDDALEADDSALAQGFPAWTGGPVSYAHFDGLGAFVAHAQILATQYGEAYVLPEAVIARASQGNAYYL